MTFKAALLAGAIGLALTAGTASAQSYYNDTSYSNDQETVTVVAPRFHVRPGKGLNGPDKLSLSQDVPYDDLDLSTYDGAHELKVRVSEAAHDVCAQLRDAYPVATINSCYRDAVQSGMLKANSAIREARYYGRY